MKNLFKTMKGVEGPATRFFNITPSDTANLKILTTAIYVGVAGNVTVLSEGDDTPITFRGVSGGQLLPIRVRRVMATGTSASSLVGLS